MVGNWARERREAQLMNELARLEPRTPEEKAPLATEPCGVSSEDYPELVCEYPSGHGVINDPEQDIFDAEHGAPSKGGWFTNSPADPAPVTEADRILAAQKDAVRKFAASLFIDGILKSDSTVGSRVIDSRNTFLDELN